MVRDEKIKKEKIGIALDQYTLEEMDNAIREFGFSSRNNFIEKAIFYFVIYLKKEKEKKKVGKVYLE